MSRFPMLYYPESQGVRVKHYHIVKASLRLIVKCSLMQEHLAEPPPHFEDD